MKNVIEAFTKNPLQRATERAAYFRTLLEGQENARKALEAKRDAALEGMPEGDGRELARIRDGLHDIGLKIAETRAGLDAAERSMTEAQAKAEASALALRWKQTGDLCTKREAAAARIQAHIAAIGVDAAEMEAMTAQIGQILPAAKPWRLLEEWRGTVRDAFERQIAIVSNGQLGDRESLGILTLVEHRQRGTPDLTKTVAQQHARILSQKPKDVDGHEPAAA